MPLLRLEEGMRGNVSRLLAEAAVLTEHGPFAWLGLFAPQVALKIWFFGYPAAKPLLSMRKYIFQS